jgi:ArsR family transcriptional regulator, arsenate/arsenite/antimonite-responsive transcriptional repressor
MARTHPPEMPGPNTSPHNCWDRIRGDGPIHGWEHQEATLAREPLSANSAVELAGILKALADPVRLCLDSLIQAHQDGEACVCDLTEPNSLSQPTVSHHLKVLRDAGLVTREKRGVWAYYRGVPAAIEGLSDLISSPSKA